MKILFHDDWEIHGDGTGDPRVMMFEPARKLLDLCDRYGARYTFFAEVMQQFAMMNSSRAEHRDWAREWEGILQDAVRRGHDVQLHLHPQWIGARFEEGRWRLDFSKWSIAELSGAEIYELLDRGKRYLESLLRPVKADFEIVAFRAGGWLAQPSGNLVAALRRAGITADCSVVPGKRAAYRGGQIMDFTQPCHRILPWWVASDDVARAGDERSGVIEIPTYAESFRGPLALWLLQKNPGSVRHYYGVYRRRRLKERVREFSPPTVKPDARRGVGGLLTSRSTYCSFGYMHHRTLMEMVRNAGRLAAAQGISDPPLVMLSHSKSFFSFSNFEKLLQDLATKPGISFMRTRDLVRELRGKAVPHLPLTLGQDSTPRLEEDVCLH